VRKPDGMVCTLRVLCTFGHMRDTANVLTLLTDIDECMAPDHGGCSVYAVCINTPGSHRCSCWEGLAGDGYSCHLPVPRGTPMSASHSPFCPEFDASLSPEVDAWGMLLPVCLRILPDTRSQRFSFWATVCKTVCLMLSVRCLSVLSCLSVTLVYCGQTVGRIKMKLGTQVGLGPGHIVLDSDPAPPPQRGIAPNFRPISVAAKWLHGSRCHTTCS